MKLPPDETIVIFAFIILIFYFMTAVLYLRINGMATNDDTAMQVLYLLIGVVSGWLGKTIKNK